MALPDEATPVTVTETFTDAYGLVESGTVTFTPSAVVVAGGATITMDPVTGRVVAGQLLAADGTSPLILAATDDVDLQPTGWTYRVDIAVGSRRRPSYYAELPSDPSPRVLHTLAPLDVPPVTGIPLVRSVNGVFPDASGDVAVSGGGGGGVPTTRRVNSGTGLTGGGDLSADRTLVVTYGTSSTSAARGDDARLSDARAPLTHTHTESDVTGLVADLGGKARKKTVMSRVVSSGNVSLATATSSWAPLTGSPTLSVPAVAGDLMVLELGSVGRQSNANYLLDVAVVVSAALRRMLGSGVTGSPASPDPLYEGCVALYHTNIPTAGGRLSWVAASGDIDVSGNVTVSFAVRALGSGACVLLSDPATPLVWALVNEGPVTAL